MVPLTHSQPGSRADSGGPVQDFDRAPPAGNRHVSGWDTAVESSRSLVHLTVLQIARLKLERAEARVKAMMDRVRDTPRTHPEFVSFKDELHRLERACFSRRLELSDLAKERRRRQPSAATEARAVRTHGVEPHTRKH
jgi:hypothetical protein